METITINKDNISKDNLIKKMKARALLFNGNNEVLIENFTGIYLLPGGKLEPNESIKEGLVRELTEEIGLSPKEDDLEFVTTLKSYQKNFPTIEGKIVNREITTHFYTGNLDVDLNNLQQHLTENEKQGNLKLEYISLDKLEEQLSKNQINDPRNKFFIQELLIIIYIINKPKYIKVRIQKKQ